MRPIVHAVVCRRLSAGPAVRQWREQVMDLFDSDLLSITHVCRQHETSTASFYNRRWKQREVGQVHLCLSVGADLRGFPGAIATSHRQVEFNFTLAFVWRFQSGVTHGALSN